MSEDNTLIRLGAMVMIPVLLLGTFPLIINAMSNVTSAVGDDSQEDVAATASAVSTTAPTTAPDTTSAVPDAPTVPEAPPTPFNWSMFWGVVAIIIVAALVLVVLFFLVRKIIRTHRTRAESKARQENLRKRWESLKDSVADTESTYAQVYSDPRTAIWAPMVTSLEFQLTRDFHKAWKACTDFFDATTKYDVDEDRYQKGQTVVGSFTRAWTDLYRKAKEVGIPGLDQDNKGRAVKLLNTILDESVGDGEAAAEKALKKIIRKSSMSRQAQREVLEFLNKTTVVSLGHSSRRMIGA